MVKRILYIAVFLLVGAGCYYAYLHPDQFGFGPSRSFASAGVPASTDAPPAGRSARINWQPVDRPGDGFKVEMPEDTRQLQVPAYNDSGVSEPVNMIFSSPDGGTNYSVAWADNPPSMRTTGRSVDQTLDAARDGLLARTQTSLVSETRCSPQGFSGRNILARNVGGGVMDARLIVAGQRLYMLTAAYPSLAARREQDVMRFFTSFAVTAQPVNSASLPASQPGRGR